MHLFWVIGQEAQPARTLAASQSAACAHRVIGVEQRDQDVHVEQRAHQ
ncbi:MAG: hypothetical protein U0842_02550 [Candidatus Binatia bacterium]